MQHMHDFERKSIISRRHLGLREPFMLYMTHSSVLFVARANLAGLFLLGNKPKCGKCFLVCVIMATNFLELAAEKEVYFTPCIQP